MYDRDPKWLRFLVVQCVEHNTLAGTSRRRAASRCSTISCPHARRSAIVIAQLRA